MLVVRVDERGHQQHKRGDRDEHENAHGRGLALGSPIDQMAVQANAEVAREGPIRRGLRFTDQTLWLAPLPEPLFGLDARRFPILGIFSNFLPATIRDLCGRIPLSGRHTCVPIAGFRSHP